MCLPAVAGLLAEAGDTLRRICAGSLRKKSDDGAAPKARRVGNPFAPHRNSVTPRVDFQGAAVFVFQKAAGLDRTPATFLPALPPRSPLIPKTELTRKNNSCTQPPTP